VTDAYHYPLSVTVPSRSPIGGRMSDHPHPARDIVVVLIERTCLEVV
jgi:hypothetical protein